MRTNTDKAAVAVTGKTKKARIDFLKNLIRTDPEVAVGAMLKIYDYQTIDEQSGGTTIYDNSVGFSGADSEFLTAMVDHYQSRGELSEKQMSYVHKLMPKYAGQLLAHGNFHRTPVTIVTEEMKLKRKRKRQEQERSKREKFSKRQALLEGNEIKIIFPYDPTLVAQVKRLSGRRFNNKSSWEKFWTAPLSIENVELLKEMNLEIDPKILSWYESKTLPVLEELDAPGLRKELYPFQKQGLAFIEARKGRALIGDEMGLGKTMQAIAYLQLHPELRPAIVVCPASVKLNWKREIEEWMGKEIAVHVISGRGPGATKALKEMIPFLDDLERYGIKGIRMGARGKLYQKEGEIRKKVNFKVVKDGIYIINYDILKSWEGVLQGIKPKILILDESHYIKNSKAQRTKAVKTIAAVVDHLICLSGTPIINRPIEFYNSIQLIEPGIFPSFWSFAQRYCGAKHNGFGWDFTGATNTGELHEKLARTIMVRRLKKDVLEDLPDKVRSIIPIELDNWDEYQVLAEETTDWVQESLDAIEGTNASQAEALVRIERLKQAAVRGKMKAMIEWIKDFIDQDQKLVVFTTHKWTIAKLIEAFGKIAVMIDGSVPPNKRAEIVDQFQTDEKIRLFIGNIKAAGIGITLTAASATCFTELAWTPGEHDQAEDRVHRIGQEADSVNAYYLLADGTIENDIADLLDEKREVLASVLDGREVEEKQMLSELLDRIANRSKASV